MPANPYDALPHNLQAERALLGLILLEGFFPFAEKNITEEDFFSTGNRIIFRTMLQMKEQQKVLDLVTLCDELATANELVKAGGAEYISGLTDGVPLGSGSQAMAPLAAPEYIRIIKEKAQERETRRLGYELSQQIQAGASNEEIIEQATQIQNQARPTAANPAIKKRASIPSFPEEAWHGMAKLYRMAMQKTSEASDNFHLAGYLTVMGVTLGKSVALGSDSDSYIYPNMYMLLVGDSGTCKDQSSKRAQTLLQRIDPKSFVVNHVASAETLVDEMTEAKKKLEEEGTKGPLKTLLYLSELRDLIEKAKQKGAGTIVSKLCQAYDVPPFISARTRGQPTAIIRDPVVSILACTNPDWMLDLDIKDLKGGLGSRVCFIPGDSKPPDRRWSAPDATAVETIQDRLTAVHLAYPASETRHFTIASEAEDLLDKWYLRAKTMQSDDPLIKYLAVRDIVHVYKISLIHAALDMRGTMVEDYHIRAAMAFVDFLRDARPAIFEGHGFSPTQVAQAAAERIIQSRTKIAYADALMLFKRNGDAMLFKRIIDALSLPGGPVEVQLVGTKRLKRYLSWRGNT